MEILKGDVYYAILDPVVGSEQGGNRPVVVVQNKYGNKHSTTVLIAPITKDSHPKKNLPTHIAIKRNDKIKHNSLILLEQIRVIDKKRLGNYLTKLDNDIIARIDKAMLISLGIENRRKI